MTRVGSFRFYILACFTAGADARPELLRPFSRKVVKDSKVSETNAEPWSEISSFVVLVRIR